MTPERWMKRVEWEGGASLAFDGGYNHNYLDDSDPEFNEMVKLAYAAYLAYDELVGRLMDHAYEHGYAEVPRP